MSTALAIASVTHVLKDLLNNGLIDHDVSGAVNGNVNVSALPPDRIDTSPTNQQSQLNLYMFQVTLNTGWRNADLPSYNGRGDRVRNPPLALDLHYLLTAYGVDELHAEILLGYGMQLLHENPVLARDAIRKALMPATAVSPGGLPPELQILSTSKLAEQIEQIKVTPDAMSTEEISKLWTAFQAKYRPTTAYVATVVLIESEKTTMRALPVRKRLLYVRPIRQPVIEKIMSQAKPDDPIVENQPILEGYNLVITGRQLRGEDVRVNVGGIDVEPDREDIRNSRIVIPLPAGLKAGVHGVQVIHNRLMGSPPVPHGGVASNIEAFVLRPRIEAPIDATSATVALTVKPAVGAMQRVVLLLNEHVPALSSPPAGMVPRAYSFTAMPGTLLSPPGPTDHFEIAISGVATGTYLARVQVDGAESPLTTDATGRFDAPQVAIP